MSTSEEEKTDRSGRTPIQDLIHDLSQHRILVQQLKGQVDALGDIKETMRELFGNFERIADAVEKVMLRQEDLERRITFIEETCSVCPESKR